MDYSELLRHVDHTLLTPTATWDQVKTVCDEGLTCRTASVCIPPRYVKRAAAYVGNQLKICTVVGFPNGYSTPEVKVFETEDAIRGGADEIDMVADLGLVKSGDWEGVLEEIKAVKASCSVAVFPSRTSASTLSPKSWRFTSCMIRNAFRLLSVRRRGFPSQKIVPLCSFIKPHRHRARVVLPAPLWPVMAVIFPLGTWKDTPSHTVAPL